MKDLSNYDSYKQLESMNQDGDILLKQWFGGFYGKYFITIPLFFIFTNEFDIKNALEKDTYLISKNNFFIIRPGCEKIKTNKEESIMLQEIEKNVFSKELTPLINVFETESYLFEFFKKKDYESLVLKLFCPVIEPFGKITGQVLLTRKKNSTDTKSFQKFFDYDSNDDFKEYLNVSKKFVESLETFNELKKKFPKLLEIIKEAVTVEILCVDHKKKNFIKRFFTFPNNQLNKTRTITALSFLALTWFSRGTIKKILKLN